MKLSDLSKVLSVLRKECRRWKQPIVGTFATGENALFKILVSTLLSLRTQDRTTEAASLRLFEVAQTPEKLLKLSQKEIEKLIYPVGFYRTKAANLRRVCGLLLERHGGKVPQTLEELLELPGVGRKTANLVMTVGHKKPGICVDTHVHRISNRWGLVRTKSPDETEMALRKTLPGRYWMGLNDLLVCYGQNLCQPVSPRCSQCKIRPYCPRTGVKRSR